MDNQFSVLLDTSFMIRLLNASDQLHQNAVDYFKYFSDQGIGMKISTISIAEFCVKGKIDELPLKNLKVLPFNFSDAEVAGLMAALVFKKRNEGELPEIKNRLVIPNDTELFAQAHCDKDVKYFVTSDVESIKMIEQIHDCWGSLNLKGMDIHIPYSQQFGVLFNS